VILKIPPHLKGDYTLPCENFSQFYPVMLRRLRLCNVHIIIRPSPWLSVILAPRILCRHCNWYCTCCTHKQQVVRNGHGLALVSCCNLQ